MRIGVLLMLLLAAPMAFGQVAPSSSGSLYDRIIKVESPGGMLQLNLEGQVYKVGLFDKKTILDTVSWNREAQNQFKQAFSNQTTGRVIALVGAGLSMASLGIRIYSSTQSKDSQTTNTLGWWSTGLSLASVATLFVSMPFEQKGEEELYGAINQYNKDVLEGK